MAMTYKHGTYGEFAKSIAKAATQAVTIPVYIGTAPVNLVARLCRRQGYQYPGAAPHL